MKLLRHPISKLFLTVLIASAIMLGLKTQIVKAQGPPLLDVSMDFGSGATVIETDAGVEFTYYLSYRCASALYNCENVVITDTLPSPLQLVGYATTPHIASVNTTGNTIIFNFIEPLPAGSTGFLEIKAMFPPGTLPGTSVVNSAAASTSGGPSTTNNTTATVAPATFNMEINKSDDGSVDNFVVGDDFSTTYLLQFDTQPGINLINPIVTDTLPAGSVYVSSNPAGSYNAGPHSVTWSAAPTGTLPMTITVGSNYQIELVVRFPNPPFSPGDPVSNTVAAAGDPEDGSGYASLPCPTCPHSVTLQAPSYGANFDKTATSASSYTGHGIEERAGQPVSYNLSYNNNGTVTATNVIVTDTVPVSHSITSIDVNPVTDPLNAYYELNSSGTWTGFPGNAYTMATTVTIITDLGVAGDQITGLRWEMGEVPYGSSWSGGFNAVLSSTLVASATLINNAIVSAVWYSNTTTITETGSANASVHIIDTRAIPRPGKSMGAGPYLPGDVFQISLTASNANVAHNVVSPTIVLGDLLPEELEVVVIDPAAPGGYRPPTFITDTWYTLVESDGALTPTATITPNHTGNQTLLRWEWDSSYAMQPGRYTGVSVLVRIKDGTPPGNYSNRAIMMWGDDTVRPLWCNGSNGGESYTDTLDLDGDGFTNDIGCQTGPQPMEVGVFLAMDSEKFVWGELDSGWNKLGWTVPGGYVDWQMIITNTSNVTTTGLIVYDILPYVGDTGVIATWEPRGSIWRPNMQAPVSAPAGVPLTISYSQSKNPCRTEIVPSGPAGCVDDWTTTFPGDATSVQALKLDFCDGGTCLELPPDDGSGSGGVVTFTWHMVAPNDAPQGAANIAWNSFGFTAAELGGTNKQLLPAEPIRVGTRLFTTTVDYYLGDYVWLDVYGQQNDGIQQPQELGIDGTRVELWRTGDTEALDYRITGPDYNGNPGYYLFANITKTTTFSYYLRFFTPMSSTLPYTFSVANQGGDDTADSDGETPGVDPVYGPYLQTADITIGPNTLDWDQGLWLPTDYGDAGWDGVNYNYPVRASDFAPVNQYLAGRHIISGSLYLGNSVDAELDGVPTVTSWGDDLVDSPDDEDGVQFEHYINTVALPTGVMIIGQNHTLRITATVPTTRTGYLNAWIDFNGDGDWNDPGEQIATDDASVGNYNLSVSVPPNAISGTTYARFRYSLEQSLTPTGTATSGEVEDYRVQLINPPVKTLTSTSAAHTTGSDVTIGEVVTYSLTVPIPEGTLPNFVITDSLPAGLRFLSDTVTVSFTGTNVASTSFTLSGDPFGDGTDPVFKLGTVTNSDVDNDEEAVVIGFAAVVLDVIGNQSGTDLDNWFTVAYDTFSAASDPITVTVVEPVLNLDKHLTTPLPDPMDIGTVITYEIVLQHDPSTDVDAFDVVITDTFPTNGLINHTLLGVSASGIAPPTANLTGNVLRVPAAGSFDLPVGAVVTVTVQAEIDTTVIPGQVITNTAGVVWTTLPGSDLNERNGGLSGEPDGSDFLDGGAVDDYELADSAAVTVDGSNLNKALTGTSATHTTGSDVTIGEIVTYTLTITLPEAVIPSLVITDDLPLGLDYVTGSYNVYTSTFDGSIPAPSVTDAGGSGGDVIFSFGVINVTNDNDPSDNSFTITLRALVLDVPGNVGYTPGQTTLTNIATVQVGTGTPTDSNPVDVDVVEPRMVITKTTNTALGGNQAGAGETITITLAAQNTGLSTAFEVIVEDPMPNSLFSSFAEETTPAGFTYSENPSGADTIIRYTGGDFAAGQIRIFTFTAVLTSPVSDGFVYTNIATVTQATTLPGVDPSERDEPDVNDSDPLTLRSLSLGNLVWFDTGAGTTNDGIFNGGEAGVDGVTVELYTSTQTVAVDTPISTTVTAGGGRYLFTNLLNGDYIVYIPAGNFTATGVLTGYWSSSIPDVDPDNDADENTDENGVNDNDPAANGIASLPVTLDYNSEPVGETMAGGGIDADINTNLTVDFGFFQPIAIGNIVWIDNGAGGGTPDNGILDGGEAAVANLTMALYTVTQTTADTPILTTTTDANGNYYFDNLAPGQYFVHIPSSEFGAGQPLEGHFSTTPTGSDETSDHDSDENGINDPDPAGNGISSQVYTLTVGGEITLEDASGYTGYAPDANANFTADFGFLRFDWGDLPDGYATDNTDTGEGMGAYHVIDDVTFLGASVDSESSGVPTAGATGDDVAATPDDEDGVIFLSPVVPGRQVTITVQAGGAGYLNAWIDFDADGALDTINLVSVDGTPVGGTLNDLNLSVGGHTIVFNAPASTTISDTIYSRFRFSSDDPAGAMTMTGVWPNGEVEDYALVSIGDVVWFDLNADANQDGGPGEPDIPGVAMNLLDGSGSPVVDAQGVPITTTTGANGFYSFAGLPEGDYIVEVAGGNWNPGQPFGIGSLYEGAVGSPGQGGDDHINTDDNGDNDFIGSPAYIRSVPITLMLGTEPITDGDTNPNSDMSIDFGVFIGGEWGDLPDIYATDAVDDSGEGIGPNHDIDGITFLGAVVDVEVDGAPSADALGDDNAAIDDEDGVTFLTPIAPSRLATITVAANAAGYLNAWIDFNADGSLDTITLVSVDGGPPTSATLNDYSLNAGSHTIVLAAPITTTISDTIYSRFRFSSDDPGGAMGATGFWPNGEVEDYALVSTGDRVWYDDNNDGTQNGGEADIPGVTMNLLYSGGSPVTDAQGNAITTTTDANGNYSFAGLPEGDYIVEVAGSNWNAGQVFGVGGAFEGVIGSPTQGGDDQNNGDDNGDNDGVFNPAYIRSVTITLMLGTEPITDGDTNSNSDMSIDFGLSLGADRGDLPDNYGTVLASSGASHIIDGLTFLGAVVDAENDGQPSLNADGDDSAGPAPDDEDGVTFLTPIMPGQAFTITVEAGGAGYLNGWIDFNGDGSFGLGEQLFSDTNLAAPGLYTYSFSAPAVVSSALYSRFRYTANSGQATTPTGSAPSGEVEDYVLMSLGNTVWLDEGAGGGAANNGLQDGAEAVIPGVTLELYLSSQTPGSDTPLAVTATGANGEYIFTGLNPDDYIVHIPAAQFNGGTLQDHHSSTGSSDPDNDVDLDDNGVDPAIPADYLTAGVSAVSITLTLGGEPDTGVDGNGPNSNLTDDFGFYRPVAIGNVVWIDDGTGGGMANNGILDGGETGINNVIVELYTSSQTTSDTPILTTTTAVSGYYQFDNLTPGDYFVHIPATNFAAGQPLESYVSSAGAGGDESSDQDADENGIDDFNPPANGISSQVYALQPATETTSDDESSYTGLLPDDSVNFTSDFGFVLAASLGDLVWYDYSRDGIQDGGEPGVENVTVILYDAGNTPVLTTTTNAGGIYSFTNLTPGDYRVRFITPTGFIISPQYQGSDDALDSDADPATGRTIVTTLDPGENDPTWDAGIYQTNVLASIGDYVWYDDDRDGIQDGGETGVAGVEVRLYGPLGNVISTTATDATGYYSFTKLFPGDYSIQFVLPAGYSISPQDQGADNAADSDADPATGRAIVTTLDPGEHDPTWDAGIYSDTPLAAIGDYVWYDDDRDGIQDAAETGVSGVTVNLYDDNDNPVASTATNAGGVYSFTNLIPGGYYVEFIIPAGYSISPQDVGIDNAADSDVDPATGRTIVTTLDPGEYDPTWDAGIYQSASIGDTAWFDDDQDGIQDAGETGVGNVTVALYDASNTPVATTTTNSSGYYEFSDLIPGDYYVGFVLPAGFTISPQDQGADDAVDSDADPTTGETIVTTLDPGENDPTWDAGIYSSDPLASLGDYVWYDDNQDGIQDGSETGVNGLTVNLYDGGGTPVASTATDPSGYYVFTNLAPGDYFVEFILPAGYAVSPQDQGGDDTADSDANPATGQTIVTTLTPGEHDPTWDAGIYQVASIGDTVWFDDDQDGIQDAGETGVGNVTVALYDASNTPVATTTTNSSGYYEFSDLTPGDYHVGFVPPAGFTISPQDQGGDDAVDSDADPITGETVVTTLTPGEHDPTWDAGIYSPQPLASLGDYVWYDSNLDGVQDGGEAPVFGVTVNLYSGGGNFVAATATDADGSYLFDNLIPGDYYLEFILPAGYVVTLQDVGADDAVDSDADPTTGRTIVTTLTPGEHDPTWDAGIYELAAIGDTVWYDDDRDGIQDAAETGVNGVSVTLYDASNAPVATTSTNAAGYYDFTDLAPGDYHVGFTLPAGYTISPQDQGADDAADSDADPTTGETIVTTLDPGENDPTWDAGIYQNAAIQVDKRVSLARVAPQQELTYTIVITNVGSAILNRVLLTDTLDAGLTYLSGTANPALDAQNGQILSWFDVTGGAGLAFGERLTITLMASVTDTVGIYLNHVVIEGIFDTGSVTDTDQVPVAVEDPSIDIAKGVTPPGVVGNMVTFTIRITNTGPSTLDIIPLADHFSGPIVYARGTPSPDTIDNLNQTIGWNDLTGPAPNGFNQNLAPGDSFIVTTVFTVLQREFTQTINTATVSNALDVFTNDANEDIATAVISRTPTGIIVSYFEVVARRDSVDLSWSTFIESNLTGFKLMRSAAGGDLAEADEIATLTAQAQGLGGANYSYEDRDVERGNSYTYWLITLSYSGGQTAYGPQAANLNLIFDIYLPVVLKNNE